MSAPLPPNPLLSVALSAAAAGLSVLPPRLDGTKAPLPCWRNEEGHETWKPAQLARADEAQIRRWYGTPRSTGIGLVTGKVSGNLELLEFDDRPAYLAYVQAAEAAGLGDLVARIEQGYHEESPKPGVHWLYRCAEIAGNTKLASRPKVKGEGEEQVLIETRGEGGFVVIAPSNGKVHPTGGQYRLIAGGFDSIATITPEERRDLWALARSFDETVKPEPEPAPKPHAAPAGEGTRPGDDFNARADWRELLEAQGWTFVYRRGDCDYWRRPDKGQGVSACTGWGGKDFFYCFSTSTQFEPAKPYDKFGFHVLTVYAGDFKAAVKALAENGYGAREFGSRHKTADTQARPAQGEGAEAGDTLQDENLFSDYGNVVKLYARLRDRLAYTPGLDWLIYNPATGIWEPEPCSERVKRLALETLRETWSAVFYAAQREEDDLKKELKALDGDDPRAAMVQKKVKLAMVRREKVFQWVRQCETAYRIRSTLEIAEGYFWTPPAIWDANPHILVCANGVLDLATGTLLPHSPGHRATKTTGTAFKPGAHHPAWEAVVTLLKSEGDRYIFVHEYCGSGLHGANPNERLVIVQGDGGTGKGTLLTAIHHALGAYAETIEVGSLLATDWRRQNKSAPREDLLKLRGARFVSPGIEPPKDSKLDDGSIKALTGNDAISARAPHAKNSITFTPVFKLIVQTNFPLRTEFDDPGMKRRVIVVPFNQKPDRPDPAIKDALIRDPEARAACLAWLYEGYRAWRNAGYALPESALATSATAEYWADMNPFAQFAADVGLKFGKLERCPKPKLTGALKAWRDETGRFDASLKGFPGWLKSKGCFDQQITGGSRLWYGVGFAEASSQQSQESPPDSVNMAVDFQYSKSTDNFTVTAGDSGYSCYADSDNPAASPAHPADDGLSSQHPPVEPTAPRCSSCLHLAGTHCRLRDETIQAPAVGSCLKWEATL